MTKSALTTKNRFLFFASAWRRGRSASGDQKRFRPAPFFFWGGGRLSIHRAFSRLRAFSPRRRVFQRRLSQRHSSPITAIIARFPPPILASSLLNALSSRFQRRRLDITHDVIILEHINSKYFVSIYIIATSFSEIFNVDSFFTKLQTLLYIWNI